MLDGVNEKYSKLHIDNHTLESTAKVQKMTNPINHYDTSELNFIDVSDISNEAISKFQREQDIKKFTKLSLDKTLSQNDDKKICELFQQIDSNEFPDSVFENISNNEKFIDDILSL